MIRKTTRGYVREIFFVIVAFVGAATYLGFAYQRGVLGFPLDDAWIHQVYARNIGTRGEFAYFAGQPSAGSTSPLWTILLGVGYALKIDFHVWTSLLGILMFAASAIVMARLMERITHDSRIAVCCSLFVLFEWHMMWSAVSGMEIPLFVFLSLVLMERMYAQERAWILGLIAGLLTLTRPEGIVLGALAGFGVLGSRKTFLAVTGYVFGFAVLFMPYLAFNLVTSGAIFPNTFYAKNIEYAILLQRVPIWTRFAQTLTAPWVGAQLLLLPGFIFVIVKLVRSHEWRALVPFAWVLALPALYALRLPVTYQHGRYEMPVVPFIVIYGVWGTVELVRRLRSFVVRGAWVASIVVVLIAFWFIGALQFATDVAVIDCEMVQTAHWAAQNIPGDEVVAAHDIGALGYFYPRPFIDLAGLVSPEVIPFIRDESRLRDFLLSRRTTFVIVFPDWYVSLTRDDMPVFQTSCAVTRAEGGTNMTVYQVR